MNATEQEKLSGFVARLGIRAEAEMVGENPNMSDFEGYHYKVKLARRNPKRSMTVYFSMGYAHTREPSAEDVLDCLASDASSTDSNSFEDWCGEMGYDTDSRRAERTYNTIIRQASKLQDFVGRDEYENLLWNTERL